MLNGIFIVPTKIDAPGVIDLQLAEGETLEYGTGEFVNTEDNQWIEQVDESMPDGYHTILSSKPIFDNSEVPEITGYRVHAIRTITVERIVGGYVTKSQIPRIGRLSDGVVVLVHSTTERLNAIDSDLKAIEPFFGIPNKDVGIEQLRLLGYKM